MAAERQWSDLSPECDMTDTQHAFGMDPSTLLARLDILEAPAAFSLPALAKRRLHEPFVVIFFNAYVFS
jgi:hypothetical protein